MPIMHMYKDKPGWFVLTNLGGNIVTFQLSERGHQKLALHGIAPGQRFKRALLYDLYLSGDAFTHGNGPSLVPKDVRQMEFDFPDDPEFATKLPYCGKCGKDEGPLYLVEIADTVRKLSLLCDKCRLKAVQAPALVMPFALLDRKTLLKVREARDIKTMDSQVEALQALWEQEFDKHWEELSKAKSSKKSQKKMFEMKGPQKKLKDENPG